MSSSVDQQQEENLTNRVVGQLSLDETANERNYSSILARFHHGEANDVTHQAASNSVPHAYSQYSGVITNEPLLDGFSLLRLVQQFLNPDIYYIGLANTRTLKESKSIEDRGDQDDEAYSKSKSVDVEQAWQAPNAENAESEPARQRTAAELLASIVATHVQKPSRRNILDEVNEMNPLNKFIDSSKFLQYICRVLTIFLSLIAIMISIDKTLSTILLCLFSRSDIRRQSAMNGKPSMPYEASDISMSWFVLILVNLSSTYIIMSTVFNGHLLWNLLNQRLFLVSRQFQYRTMLSLLIFAYLEYMINISFINNLFGWSFETEDIESNGKVVSNNFHDSYSILSRLEIFVTDQDAENSLNDILLTVFQFSRGVIRISPYVTIIYVIICLNEHIKTIRNQDLLNESLKKKQKLRFVVKSSRAANLARASKRIANHRNRMSNNGLIINGRSKKRVIFATDASANGNYASNLATFNDQANSYNPLSNLNQNTMNLDSSHAPNSTSSSVLSNTDHHHHSGMIGDVIIENHAQMKRLTSNVMSKTSGGLVNTGNKLESIEKGSPQEKRNQYCNRIRDFYELESYITNLYIFTGRLNRLMSRQGLAMFFIVHNLVISCSLIVPEAIRGGPPMVYFIRLLVIIIGIVPFKCGQSLNGQLEQLSKQIDRIIIHQQFFGQRRDNLVRIRELLHDIRVNCGGMLNFNIETGLKYLVIAFASAFFIEQEGELSLND